MTNPYRVYGIVLAVAGAVLIPVFYFIAGSVPLTAVALSSVILGLTGVFLANARPYVSPETCQVLLRTGMENTSALLEELGIRNKAIYLPSGLRNGHPQAMVPLSGEIDAAKIKDKLPGRLIVRYGPGSEEMGLAITTAGSLNIEMLENKPGPTADEMESSLNYLLTGVLDIARGVSLRLDGNRIEVKISGARMAYQDIWYYQCLGSPLGSIAAAVCCEGLGKPVRIMEEKVQHQDSTILIEVLA
jgi:hypothetical protein